MASTGTPTAPAARLGRGVPPLENGDRLSRTEFERRYVAMPHVKKAELVEGVVHMPSPVHLTRHASPHAEVLVWLGVYKAATPGVQIADNATVRLDLDNELQPDALMRLVPEAGGRSASGPDDFLEGPPELVVEIAASNASYDLHEKKRVYRRNGVSEYLVWLVDEGRVAWWALNEGDYVSLPVEEDGTVRSRVFPGLWLDTEALVGGRTADLLNQLQRGLASEAHGELVAGLRSRLGT